VATTVSTRHLPAPGATGTRRVRARDDVFVVGFAGFVGLVVTVGLWLRHGGVGAATGPGGTLTAIGQVTALVGTYAVLAQLVLMSRLSWIERAIGLDRLAVWHRWVGFTAVWLLSAHVAFTTLGYARGDKISLWHQTRDFLSHYPDVLMAWVGFALFLAIAFTSVRIARRALQRQTWYFIHLYAYLAIALTFAHQLAVGTDFNGDRAARVWWVGLYVVVFGTMLWWRVVVPVRHHLQHALRVERVLKEAPGVASIYVTGQALDRFGAQPGQFFLWRFLTPSGWWQAHPFSLSAAPSRRRFRMTVKDLGDYTHQLQRVKRGTRVMVEGPFGTFTSDRRTNPNVLLVAGGIGITPLRALLDSFGPGDDVVLLFRVERPEDVIFAEELREVDRAEHRTVYVIPGAEIGDDHTDLLSLEALRRFVPDVARRECFVCGPPGMIVAIRRRLRLLGVPAAQVHHERFEF
jgi:predicted ferric reductase